MATRVPDRSAQKQYAACPTAQWCCICNFIRIGQLAFEILMFEGFPIVTLWRLLTPGAWPNLTPGAWMAGFMKRTTSSCHIPNIKVVGLVVSEKKIFEVFPLISQWEFFKVICCHSNQSSDPICPKMLCSLSPCPMIVHMKFDQHRPSGFWDILVWNCEQTTDDDDRRRTPAPSHTNTSPEPSAQVS